MLNRMLDCVLKLSTILGGVVLVFITVSVNYEVVVRYFLNSPTNWVADFTCYGLIYLTFTVAAWVLAKEGHVKIDVLLNCLSEKNQRILNTITSIVGTLLSAVFFWYSLKVTVDAFQSQQMFITGLILPKWPVLMIMPIGTFILVLQFMRRTWTFMKGH